MCDLELPSGIRVDGKVHQRNNQVTFEITVDLENIDFPFEVLEAVEKMSETLQSDWIDALEKKYVS